MRSLTLAKHQPVRPAASLNPRLQMRAQAGYAHAIANQDHRPSGVVALAKAVLGAGKTLWKTYFAHTDERSVRDEFKLNRADVGWYQIRNALKARSSSGDTAPVNFTPFETAYTALTEKLQPLVFELGFLR